MQRFARLGGIFVSLSVAVIPVSACSGTTPQPTLPFVDSVIGTYALKSVDGVAVPGTSGGTYWRDGSLAISADKTFVQELHFSGTPSGSIVTSGVNGTWARSSATTLALTPTSAPFAGQTQEFTISGRSLIRPSGNLVFTR